MSRYVLVGFGYTAGLLADLLLEEKLEVIAISRRPPEKPPLGITHLSIDISEAPIPIQTNDIIYYFVPPLSEFEEDVLLEQFLNRLPQSPRKIIYIGSSGVYG